MIASAPTTRRSTFDVAGTAHPLRRARTISERIAIDPDTGCWRWLGFIDRDGYGKLAVGSRRLRAHRFSYELHVGAIAPGLTLDHLCRNRACVNPVHLEPVTNAENVRRGNSPSAVNARKSECVNGHPLDEANTYRWTRPNGREMRSCRICQNEASAAYRRRRKNSHPISGGEQASPGASTPGPAQPRA